MESAYISRLNIYPIKSLDPVEITEAEVGIHSLKNDRQFALVDEQGRYINGKRTGRVNQLQAAYDLSVGLVHLSPRGSAQQDTFELRPANPALEEYLSDFFKLPTRLMENSSGQFMDIPKASSVTIVSEASLQALQKDMPTHSLEELRLRFRTNIELAGVPAFWEETLFGQPGIGRRFRLGAVELIGVSPRARCNVPPQHPLTGEMDRTFVKKMIESRQLSLPEGSTLLQHGRSTYHLTTNVFLPESEAAKTLAIGDKITVLEAVNLGG